MFTRGNEHRDLRGNDKADKVGVHGITNILMPPNYIRMLLGRPLETQLRETPRGSQRQANPHLLLGIGGNLIAGT